MTRIHFISLGCPKNLVDSEVMLGLLSAEGAEFTDDPADADAIIVNTCAFIGDAKQEAVDTILAMGQHRTGGRCRKLIVTGCLPQRYRDEVARLFPEVDAFVGAGEFPRIAQLLRGEGRAGEAAVLVGRPTYLYDHDSPRLQATPAHLAYIKIAEGCFHPCSFCVIPKIRGAFRSRDPRSIVAEASAMLERGVLEINLIAQDTTAYGRDNGASLARLMRDLDALPGRKWIRLMYAYPHGFPWEVAEAMAEGEGICRYLDIPIQHISDRILASMRRKGEGREVRELLSRLRRSVPGIALRTSLITGFPGERDEDFEELMAFVREARFEHLGVFTFSPEEGTPAARLAGRVPIEVAEERRQRLMELQRKIAAEQSAAMVGRRLTALVEGPSEETELLLANRHQGQAPGIDGIVYINEGNPAIGAFAEVEIVEAHDYDLVARVLEGR